MAYGQKLRKLRVPYFLELLKLVPLFIYKVPFSFAYLAPRPRYGYTLVLKRTIETSKFFAQSWAFFDLLYGKKGYFEFYFITVAPIVIAFKSTKIEPTVSDGLS